MRPGRNAAAAPKSLVSTRLTFPPVSARYDARLQSRSDRCACPCCRERRLMATRVTSEVIVHSNLIRRQNSHRRKMIPEVGGPKRSMCRPNRCCCLAQARSSHRASGELVIKLGFLRDEPLTERDRLGFHGLEEILYAVPLRLRQAELLPEFEHMARAGIPVEL